MDKQTLHSLAQSARPDSQSHLNCRPINEAICNALQAEDISCEVVDGRVTRYELRGEGPEHSFIIVTDAAFSSTPIIVDGALEQFCEENREQGYVTFSLGSNADIPTVVVASRNDEYYENYSW